jgi:hypothetical protein
VVLSSVHRADYSDVFLARAVTGILATEGGDFGMRISNNEQAQKILRRNKWKIHVRADQAVRLIPCKIIHNLVKP